MGTGLDWEFIKAQLPPDWKQRAVEMGLIRPQLPHLHTKVTDIEQVLHPLMHRVGLNKSLCGTMAEADSAGVIDMSSVALHKWERKLAPYLSTLVADLLREQASRDSWRYAGYEVVVVDSTVITDPSATGTTARVHYVLRLADLTIVQMRVADAHVGETVKLFDIGAEQLWIADRNYANPPGVAAIVQAGAAVVARYNRGALPLYDEQGEPFDVLEHVRRLDQAGASCAWSVRGHPKGAEPVQGRLCALRLPDDKVEEARHRLRRDHGRDVSAEMLEAANWVMLFTTVPSARMSTQQVIELYRLRWQVELEIKRDKFLGGLDELPNFRHDTIETWLYAKMLLQLIARKLVTSAVAFPPGALRAGAERAATEQAVSQSGACTAPRAHAAHRYRDLAHHGPGAPGASRRARLRPAP
jgi:hypothetical protein